jgi:hypothetical protein
MLNARVPMFDVFVRVILHSVYACFYKCYCCTSETRVAVIFLVDDDASIDVNDLSAAEMNQYNI